MHFYFEEAEQWAFRKQNIFRQINEMQLPLVLFGVSPVIDFSFLQEIRVPVQYICDNDPVKQGRHCADSLEVIAPEQISAIYSAYTVLILVPFAHEIIPQLQQLTIPPSKTFQMDLYFEEPGTAEYFQRMQPDLESVYNRLADQASKDVFETIIRYRMNRDPLLLKRISLPRKTQYFPDALDGMPFLHSEEIFVDAGAFTGDTAIAFCKAVHNKYDSIYAFEPEMENFGKLVERTKKLPHIFRKRTAVSDRKTELHFAAEDSSSKAVVSGGQTVPADTLDHLLDGVPVTYLKMDVEGMECAALRGAERLIQLYHPKLAVCTYHSNADMIQVPKLIWKMNPDYKLYFRHYTHALVETVCYAV